jgi:hypothetical protein
MGLDRNGISSHAEHVGKKFLGQAERVFRSGPGIAGASGKADYGLNGGRGRHRSAAPAREVSTDIDRLSFAGAGAQDRRAQIVPWASSEQRRPVGLSFARIDAH